MNVVSPLRAERSYTQQLNAPPEAVFPLLCPVREVEWIPEWRPSLVVSSSGAAELDCIFTTETEDGTMTWIVTRYEPPRIIEFARVLPGSLVSRVRITLLRLGADRCTASISYQHTALSPAGEAYLLAFTEERYREQMRLWERRLNHYLATGAML